ncbi:BEN domain-containing protein 5-like isoform X2 [Dermacentor albipictus]|uniref:BEN domain-containing protein 5-like isoform X2 n=1 Tax=Dermacentor albipictus TaxID=60249 RepID=UPI0038FC83CD
MLAYVKYRDNYRAILPVRLIKSFEPENEEDFTKAREVQAHWCSEDGATEGYYPAFVHALADTLDGLNTKLKKMRESFPRLIKVQGELPASRKHRKEPTPREVKKQRVAATEALHERILEQHKASEPPEDVAELKSTIEKQATELRKLKQKLKEADEVNKKLTLALLDKFEIARKSRDGEQPSVTMGHQASEVPDPVVCTAAPLNEGVLESTTMDEGDSSSSTTARMGLASEATASGSAVSPAAAHTGPPEADELFCVVNGQVLVGENLHMPENKWQYIMKSRGDAKCVLDVARHLWTPAEAGERSLTGQACRTMSESSGKLAATPAKVDAVKNCLEKYVALHPSGPAAPPAEHRVAAVRKHLRSFFTEAARQGKRVRQPKRAEASLPDGQ